jgi:hypothetical protein
MIASRIKVTSFILIVFVLGLWSTPQAGADEATRLRILFVVDGNAKEIGQSAVSSYKRMLEVFGAIKAKHENRFTWEVYEKENAKPANVLHYYKNELKDLKPTDALLFYYTGHGAWDKNPEPSTDEKGHYLAMTAGNLYRSELRKAMLARNPFAVFIITDCCSTLPGVDPPRRDGSNFPAVGAVPQGGQPQWQLFRNLFFQQRGVVDIQAATRGEFSWFGSGGGPAQFTTAFTGLLCQARSTLRGDGRDGFVSWNDFFPRLQYRTLHLFRKLQYDLAAAKVAYRKNPTTNKFEDVRNYRSQTPNAFYLGEWPEHQRYLKVVNNTGQKLKLWVWPNVHDPATKQWKWYGGANGYYWELAPGANTYLRVDKWVLRGHSIKYWATTPTLKWESYRNTPRVLVPSDGYRKVGDLGTWTMTFP